MKTRNCYLLPATCYLLLALITACTTDELIETSGGEELSGELIELSVEEIRGGEYTPVTLSFGALSAGGSTRADDTSDTEELAEGEGMYTYCVVVMQTGTSTIVDVAYGTCDTANCKQQVVTFDYLSVNDAYYDFYCFANIDVDQLITARSGSDEDGLNLYNWASGSAPDTQTWTMAGNGYEVSATNPIPMSNKMSSLQIKEGDTDDSYYLLSAITNQTIDALWTVRMLAKMEFTISNDSGTSVTVNSITISDITPNEEDNIYFLPTHNTITNGNYSGEDQTGTGWCIPRIKTATREDYTYVIDGGLEIEDNSEETVIFYVNESNVTATRSWPYYSILINTSTESDAALDDTDRYTIISWDTIARNEWHKIPVSLGDYTTDLVPYDFTAIGVYPTSVKNEDGVFTITFHDSNHFHLQPIVTQISTNEVLSYAESGDSDNATYSISALETYTPSKYLDYNYLSICECAEYETSAFVYTAGETVDTSDKSENGGIPIWDATQGYWFGNWNDDFEGSIAYIFNLLVTPANSTTSRAYEYKVYLIRTKD